MDKIEKRSFEYCSQYNTTVIVCIIGEDEKCTQCVSDIENEKVMEKFPYVKFYTYDISTDFEKLEAYEIVNLPTVLFFKDGQLIKKFEYSNTKDLVEKVTKYK